AGMAHRAVFLDGGLHYRRNRTGLPGMAAAVDSWLGHPRWPGPGGFAGTTGADTCLWAGIRPALGGPAVHDHHLRIGYRLSALGRHARHRCDDRHGADRGREPAVSLAHSAISRALKHAAPGQDDRWQQANATIVRPCSRVRRLAVPSWRIPSLAQP